MKLEIIKPGFSCFGQCNQTYTVMPISEEMFRDTFDTDGSTWLLLDEDQQRARWGDHYFNLLVE